MDRLLLLIPSTTYNTHEFIEAAERLRAEVVVASERRQVLEAAVPEKMLALDLYDLERAVEQIAEHARRWPIGAVVGVDDHTALLAAMAHQALGIASANSPESVRAAGNKLLLRTALSNAGLASPAFTAHEVAADPRPLASTISYPCVLKPLFLAASRGVIRADDEDGFAEAWVRIEQLLARPVVRRRGGDDAGRILVEDYIPGIEVALEGLLSGGELDVLALFDKPDPLEGPYFAETLYITPSALAPELQEQIAATTEAAASALGLREGPVHAELRINDKGIFVVECAARSIGGLCSRILRFGAGISLEELVLGHLLGRAPDAHLQREERAGGVMMLPVPSKGVLREVRGADGARLVDQVEDVVITIPYGERVEPLPEGDRYLGFVFARGDSPRQVEEALRRAYRQLEVVIGP